MKNNFTEDRSMKLNNLISNIAAITFISLLFIFALTWIIFDFNDSSSALKDTWSIIGSVFGGFATLVAAYIASQLFNDWKEQHNKQVKNDFALRTYNQFKKSESSLFTTNDIWMNIRNQSRSLITETPLGLDHPFVIEMRPQMILLSNNIEIFESEYKFFISQLNDYGVVCNKENEITQVKFELMNDYVGIKEKIETYNEYKVFLYITGNKLESYFKLLSKTNSLIISKLLKQLQE